MLECLILGDSIAVGVTAARPECVHMATVGINSRDWWHSNGHRPLIDMMEYHTVVISLGTNDGQTPTLTYLELIRGKVKADRVLWIVPQAQFAEARSAVLAVADQFRDSIIEIPTKDLARDKIHPTASGYQSLAAATKK